EADEGPCKRECESRGVLHSSENEALHEELTGRRPKPCATSRPSRRACGFQLQPQDRFCVASGLVARVASGVTPKIKAAAPFRLTVCRKTQRSRQRPPSSQKESLGATLGALSGHRIFRAAMGPSHAVPRSCSARIGNR